VPDNNELKLTRSALARSPRPLQLNSVLGGHRGHVKAIRVAFRECTEVRMGSPYKVCRVELQGGWVPTLPEGGQGFQDLAAWSADGHLLALVRWSTPSNSPGFKILVVSVPEQKIHTSRRIKGCCQSLVWEAHECRYTAWLTGSFTPPRGHLTRA
jgi:hypothetical protein